MARSVYNQDDSHGDDGKSYVHNEYDGNRGTMAIKAIKAIMTIKAIKAIIAIKPRMKRRIFLAKRRNGSDGKILSGKEDLNGKIDRKEWLYIRMLVLV